MSVDKNQLRKKFAQDWKKHYKVQFLEGKGFRRKQCEKCRSFFWTVDEDRGLCGDASCTGYDFIGKGTKHLGYVETWQEIEKYFRRTGHTSIKRYPVVSRWRDDLYFTNASIIDFQPYVVTGEVEPPANPLIVPQTSLRFKDVTNVGLTGAHYTCFVMFGQHAFNNNKTKQFYWKDEALMHDYNYLQKVIGVKAQDLTFKEDVWAGGGTFGPCIEYFAGGIELGNCVFMQFEDLGNGKYRELNTKVVDMGAGLERLAWYTNGTPTSYDVTYGPVLKKMAKNADLQIDKKLFTEYAKLAGRLNIDDVKNLHAEKERIAKHLGVSYDELYGNLERLQALYAVADHLKTILYTTTDGMLPSNSGGGYNLRMLLRRVFGFNDELKLNLNYAEIIRAHSAFLKNMDTTIAKGVPTTISLLQEEKQKFLKLKETSRKKLDAVIAGAKKGAKLEQKELVKLYESDGIPVEMVQEFAGKQGISVEVPDDFYGMIAKKNEKDKRKIKSGYNIEKFPKTRMLFYGDPYINEFAAKVVGVVGTAVVLDKTLFYPEAGGQAADIGELNSIEILDVQNESGVVLHHVKNASKFRRGMKVFGRIDVQRRLALMRHHTATHLLNAAARELLGQHIWQAGAQKDADKAHLDLTHYKRITDKELKVLEILVNERILANIPVKFHIMPRNKAEEKFGFRIYQGGFVPGKELRIVEIKGIDVQACGGTHVSNTGEIGFFKIIKREGVKDGVERITFAAGMPAIEYVQKRDELISKSAEVLGVPEQALLESTSRFFREWKGQRKNIQHLQEQLGEKELSTVEADSKGRIVKFLPETDAQQMLKMAQKMVELNPAATVILCESKGNLLVLCGSESVEKSDAVFKEILKKCGGVGGGNKKIARGKIKDVEKAKKIVMQ